MTIGLYHCVLCHDTDGNPSSFPAACYKAPKKPDGYAGDHAWYMQIRQDGKANDAKGGLCHCGKDVK